MTFWLLGLSLVLLSFGVDSRTVKFINSCAFTIDVEANTGIVCGNVAANGGSCFWTIPSSGWSGQFHRKNRENDQYGFPSGTLAEFNFANNLPGEWNWDWFDISIIPPGCPGDKMSYDDCWCNSNADGYDVGMVIRPLSCQSLTRTCLNRYCSGAYLYPKDDTKTTVCKDIGGSWEVQFCPPGSTIDLGNTKMSQVPPCRGGGGGSNPPPPPSGSCSVQDGVDFFGNDLSNKPVANSGECCNYCYSIGACQAWTYAGGVCYAKSAAGAATSKGGLVSGKKAGAKATVDDTQTFDNQNESPAPMNQTWLWVGISIGAALFVALVIGIVVLVTLKKNDEERA